MSFCELIQKKKTKQLIATLSKEETRFISRIKQLKGVGYENMSKWTNEIDCIIKALEVNLIAAFSRFYR